jgi:hypothetical protein
MGQKRFTRAEIQEDIRAAEKTQEYLRKIGEGSRVTPIDEYPISKEEKYLNRYTSNERHNRWKRENHCPIRQRPDQNRLRQSN